MIFAVLLAVASAAEGDGSTALLSASYRDDLEAAGKLIRDGADVNAANDLGATALWAACQNGSEGMVRLLLGAGANPNARLLKGETPLMTAARTGHAGVVELLLQKGAKHDARGARGQTALMWAVAQKHSPVVKVLLAHGADVHARSEVWKQMMAVPPHGHPEYNREIPHGGDTALLFAARVGDLASAKLLIGAGANVNDCDAWGVSALVYAAHSDFRDVAELLLEKGADPNLAAAGFTALHAAVMHRDEQLVAALLARGADPNMPVKTWTPTRRSSRDYHFPPSLIGATPFWLAARSTQPGVMRLLAKHGADPRFVHRVEYLTGNYKTRHDENHAIHAALGMGGGVVWVPVPGPAKEALALEAVKTAVELGVDPRSANSEGRTPLEAAKELGYRSVAGYLNSLR